MKLTSKTLAWFGAIGVAAATATTVPLILSQTKTDKTDKINVDFHGIHFYSKKELLTYIRSNISTNLESEGNTMYTVAVGDDEFEFDSYRNAIDFIKVKIKEVKVYLKPEIKTSSLSTISPDNFVKKEGTREYIAFEKVGINIPNNDVNKNHTYSFAMLPNEDDSDDIKKELNDKIDEARLEAARSFIQIHSAYKFDGIYFQTKSDMVQYITNNRSKTFDQLVTGSMYSVIPSEYGTLCFSQSNLQSNDEKKIARFKNQIINLARPVYNTASDGQEDSYVEVTQANAGIINVSDSDLDYIKITPNESEETQIVDMDSSTPNGNLFGNYFIKSGLGMEGASNDGNWEAVGNKSAESIRDGEDILVLKSIMTYILKANNFGSILSLLNKTKLVDENSKTFSQFLLPNNENNQTNFLSEAINLIVNMSKGSRYNSLDTITSLHSYLINSMIRQGINSKYITKVAQYFDSMMKVMDSLLAPLIAPFLTSSTATNFHLDYLSTAFNFYDESQLGNGINFEDNPYSYYRKLIGNNDDNKSVRGLRSQNNARTRNIFNMLKAALGVQSISFNALRHNQKVFSKWESYYIQEMNKKNINSYYNVPIKYPKYVNSLEDDKIWDFSFGLRTNAGDEERIGVWDNLSKMTGGFQITPTESISSEKIRENYEDYLKNYQNNIIDNYIKKIKAKISFIRTRYEYGWDEILKQTTTVNGNNVTKEYKKHFDPVQITSDEIKNNLTNNLFAMIDLPQEDKYLLDSGVDIASSYSSYTHLNDMVKNAVKPLDERIIDFATNVGTFVAQVAIAVVTAGAGAEASMVEEEISAESITSSVTKTNGSEFSLRVHSGGESTRTWMNKESISESLTSKRISVSKRITHPQSNIQNKLKNAFDAATQSNEKTEPGSLIFQKIQDEISKTIDYSFDIPNTSEQKRIGNIVIQVTFNILKNVVPGLSKIIGIIESFSGSESTLYVYKNQESDSQLYWNGDLVEYSWWGLNSDHKYSIEDLKMINPIRIISGYSATESGYYYGNEVHETLADLKLSKSREIIHSLIGVEKDEEFIGKHFDNVKWILPLKGQTMKQAKKCDSINELINYMKNIANENIISEKLFQSPSGALATAGKAFDSAVGILVEGIKKTIVIKMPTRGTDEKLMFEDDFTLPIPNYKNGAIRGATDGSDPNLNYIIFDPNVHFSESSNDKRLEKDLGASGQDDAKLEAAQNLLSSLEELSNNNHFRIPEKIEESLNHYAKNIYIDSKIVLFETLNKNIGVTLQENKTSNKPWSFEALDDNLTKDLTSLYEIKTKDGHNEYYSNKTNALLELKNDENYMLQSSILTHEALVYKFDDRIFHSINGIYDYIVNQEKWKGDL